MSGRLLDPKFKYTPSFDTDVRKTFDRHRKEQKAKAQRLDEIRREAEAKVEPITRRKTAK